MWLENIYLFDGSYHFYPFPVTVPIWEQFVIRAFKIGLLLIQFFFNILQFNIPNPSLCER